MTEKRFYCDAELEYRGYGIFDLSKADKTKEDFYDKKEECYALWMFNNYLIDETNAMMTGEEVREMLNALYKENQELKKRLKALDDAFMDFEQKLYLEVFDIKLSREDEKAIYEYLRKLGEGLLE